jgi:pyruvate dehydrogenase E2 component (dihydrolipoamide acetyltransferase)
MIRDMILPQLAMGMSEGKLVEWMVKEGCRTDRDVAAVVIETEKVSTELPVPYAGFFHIVVDIGQTVPIETVIAKIAETEAEYHQLTSTGSGAVTATNETAIPPAAMPVVTAASDSVGPAAKLRISGLARKIAIQRGINLSTIEGTGPGGRIVRRDVTPVIEAAPQIRQEAAPQIDNRAITGSNSRAKARIPLTGMRAVIAERMVKAKASAAHTYFFFEADITKLVAARETMLSREQELGGRISQVAILVRALALACQHVPICNSTLVGDEIIVWENVNVGVAVALPGKTEFESGLVVPVILNVESKGVLAIDREMKDLVARARAGKLSPQDMADGTITVSSTGGFLPGVWCVSTPLINLPQVVNFQPGTAIEKPVVIDGQVVTRTMLPCGLSFDHRAMDGEPIGRFIKKLTELLSNPELMLL